GHLFYQRPRAAPARVTEEIQRATKLFGFIVRPVNKHRPANDQIARNKSPGPAIQAVVAVVAHYEIRIVGYFGWLAVNREVKISTRAQVLPLTDRRHSLWKIVNV